MFPNAAIWIVPACFAAFALLWVATCRLVAVLSGWRALAARYPAAGPAIGTSWHFQSAVLRRYRYLLSNYGNCLHVTVNAEGLGLAVLWLLQAGHPPLWIPWSELLVSEDRLWYFIKCVRVTFPAEPSVSLWIQPSPGRSPTRSKTPSGQDWFAGGRGRPRTLGRAMMSL